MHDHHSGSDCPHVASFTSNRKLKLLLLVLVLTWGFALAELLTGYFSHSLGLVADSGHLMSDGLAIVLALLAAWLAQRSQGPEGEQHPVELLAALLNSLFLVAVALWIGWEALERLQAPGVEIYHWPMLIVATLGLGVNGMNIFLLHRDSSHDLNVRAVFLHLLGDAASSLGVLLAAIAISLFDWFWMDSVISLGIALLILGSSLPLVFQSFGLLLTSISELKITRTDV